MLLIIRLLAFHVSCNLVGIIILLQALKSSFEKVKDCKIRSGN